MSWLSSICGCRGVLANFGFRIISPDDHVAYFKFVYALQKPELICFCRMFPPNDVVGDATPVTGQNSDCLQAHDWVHVFELSAMGYVYHDELGVAEGALLEALPDMVSIDPTRWASDSEWAPWNAMAKLLASDGGN